MNKNDEALFKQALSEGVSNRFSRKIDSCTENVVASPAHYRAMNRIISGSSKKKSFSSPKLKKIIAILVAAALLLTGCAVIYRNEIRDFIEEIYESFVKLNYSDGEDKGVEIEEAYELTYIPEGYSLKSSVEESIKVKYTFVNSYGDKISFMQNVLDTRNFYMDIETGYTQIVDISRYDVYYKSTKGHIYYLWNDGKYTFRLTSDVEISTDELNLIIDGIK